jgi:putative endonuclease
MHYVYVLLSLKDSRFYTGYTEDLRKRLEEHQQGRVNSTRDRRPLELAYYEGCLGKGDALRREKYLKTTWGKRYLRSRLKSYLELPQPPTAYNVPDVSRVVI